MTPEIQTVLSALDNILILILLILCCVIIAIFKKITKAILFTLIITAISIGALIHFIP